MRLSLSSFFVALALSFSTALPSADGESLRSQELSRPSLQPLMEILARQVAPGAELKLVGRRGGAVVYDLTGIDEPPPRLLYFGAAYGHLSDPLQGVGMDGPYRVPQLVVGLALLDPSLQEPRCGYALLEPVLTQKGRAWRGLKRLALGSTPEWTCFCGPLRGLREACEDEEASGAPLDLHRVVTETLVLNRRLDSQDPPVFQGTCVVDLHLEQPRPLRRDAVEVASGERAREMWIEYFGVDEERIRARYGGFDRPEVALPDELRFLSDRHPDLQVLEVATVPGTGTSRIRGLLPTEKGFAQILRDLQQRGLEPNPRTMKTDATGYSFEVLYTDGEPGSGD